MQYKRADMTGCSYRRQKLTALRPAMVALVPVAGTAPEGPHTDKGICLPLASANRGGRSVMWSLCRCDRNTCNQHVSNNVLLYTLSLLLMNQVRYNGTLLIVARLTCVAYRFTIDPVPASRRKF